MKRSLVMLLLLAATFAVDRPLCDDPQTERIVRASFVEGDASYQRGDAEEWNSLGVNTPLMTGDSIYMANGARAEISLGRGSFARVGGGAQLDLVSLTGAITQLGVDSGRLSLRVHSVPEGSVIEVDTPSATATIREPGLYRIGVDDRRSTYEVVDGGMSVVLGGEQLDVDARESLSLESAEPPTYEFTGPQPAGPFDNWVNARDQRYEHAESTHYVHPDVEGQEDLDARGTWRPDPTYGRVWVPAGVGPEWAPYQAGRWVWQDPYGWTWVSYEDWGWAPYHYGRWVAVGGTWAWVPPPPMGYVPVRGVIMPQPVYAPALVAFVGGSNWHIGVSVGGGSAVGWVPLAPAEPYYYPWQTDPRPTTTYRNVTVINAVTVVNVNNFVSGGGNRYHVNPRDIERAPRMGCNPRGIEPTPDSLAAYPHRRVREGAVPVRAGQRRPLVARLVPPPRQISFKEKKEMIHKTGRPVERPVAFGEDVGKPFHKGARVPQGVNAVSALSPERPEKLKARHEGKERAPRPIEGDLLPVQGKSVGRPAGVREHTNPNVQNGRRVGGPSKSSMGDRPAVTQSPGEGASPAPGGTPQPPNADPQRNRQRVRKAGEAPTPPPNFNHGAPAKPAESAPPAHGQERQHPGATHPPVNPPAPPAAGTSVKPGPDQVNKPASPQAKETKGKKPAPNDKKKDEKKEGGGNR